MQNINYLKIWDSTNDANDFEELKNAISQMRLNYASIKLEFEISVALRNGFIKDFLGLLHFVLG